MNRRSKPKGKAFQRLRVAVFTRDGWRCCECAQSFEVGGKELAGISAPSFLNAEGTWTTLELAHLVPWQAGGLYTLANLRALCTPCNRSEGRTTEVADWTERVTLAVHILSSRQANATTARQAIRALEGGETFDAMGPFGDKFPR